MSKTPSSESNATSGSDGDFLLAGYSGPALLVQADGTVLATNQKGVTLETLLKFNGAPEIPRMIAHAAKEQTIAAGTVSMRGTRGKVVLEVSVIPLVDQDRLVVLVRDMTMERNLRSALASSRQRYKDMVEVSGDFYWEVDRDGVFQFISPKDALGYQADELIDRNAAEVVVDAAGYETLPFHSEQPLENTDLRLRLADGSEVDVKLSCRPILTPRREVKGVRGVCRINDQESRSS